MALLSPQGRVGSKMAQRCHRLASLPNTLFSGKALADGMEMSSCWKRSDLIGRSCIKRRGVKLGGREPRQEDHKFQVPWTTH